jgi:hypothetical protein
LTRQNLCGKINNVEYNIIPYLGGLIMKNACLPWTIVITLLVPLILFTMLFNSGCAEKEPEPGYKLKTVKSSALNLKPNAQPYFLRRQSDAKVKTAKIQIASQKFDVILPAEGFVRDCWLVPERDPEHPPRWWGADKLNATHLVDGKYYRLSLTNDNQRILVNPYSGDFGTFRVGKGDRDIEKVEASGSLRAEDTAVMIGNSLENGSSQPAESCTIPVGDYLPALLYINMDNLRIMISENYHTNAKGQTSNDPDREKVYGFTIRKDKPFTLDFSNKPMVVFEDPKSDHRVKLGEELQVVALLIDPELDIMIRGLDDTSQKVTQEYTDSSGEKHSYETDLSLDPTVTIARFDDEVVAEGKMPFG